MKLDKSSRSIFLWIKKGSNVNFAKVIGKDCFNDPASGKDVMYCGDWWNTNFFMNLTIREVLGAKIVDTPRCAHLAEILQVDLDWKINSVSDGQRRRCQLDLRRNRYRNRRLLSLSCLLRRCDR